MQITGVYSHKGGLEYIKEFHSAELQEVYDAVSAVTVEASLTKLSSEKTKKPLLFSPISLNNQIKNFLHPLGWTGKSDGKKGFKEPRIKYAGSQFREMDGIKNKVGLEVQFGKYAFMGYDIFLKMPVFAQRGLITCGIELVVMPSMISNMSTGVSSYAQIVADMEARGVADLDIPTIVLGFECSDSEWRKVEELRRNHRNGATLEYVGLSGNKPGPK
ncbi:hypothetical protein N9X60_01560 [Paracoccaceae bacterium]|nr:hypothetical protein [Paracoccaceae bacterium]